jgi:ABC-type antimicrobial peptide transport system permease subunit
MALVLQSAEGWPITFVPLLRRAAAGVDASLPLYDVRTMEDIVVSATAHRRFYLRLVLLLATTGLGLAILGIYGVIAYFVTLRSAEMGLRLALGARRATIVRLVVGHGLRLTAIGIALGLPAALALTRLMRGLLYEVVPSDPATFAAVIVILLMTTTIAALVPSAKAARVDPLVALRHE